MNFLERILNARHRVPVANRTSMKYAVARQNYGRKLSAERQRRLVEQIAHRLVWEHGRKPVKPRVRYKLRTVRTQYCGYLFVEWK